MRRFRAYFPLLILLMLGPAAALLADTGAAFVGLAAASAVSEDADGLTVLEGVHHAVWVDELPYTEDLVIYTRWSGSGSHVIGVDLVHDATGDTVASVEDEVDFGSQSTTFSTHDFSDTTFEEPGLYWLEVTLDGDSVASSAYYVNADDQFPEYPEIVLSVPAERGGVDDYGDAGISGIFEYFSFAAFPATDSFSVVTLWFSGDGEYEHAVRIVDPRGTTIASSESQVLDAYYGEMTALTDTFDRISFVSPGAYSILVELDGDEVLSYPLYIEKE
jgi:hypothetical protein